MRNLRVFVTGTFDLLHPGHVWLLNQCRKIGRVGEITQVIVAVSPDKLGPKYKRKRILDQKTRIFMIKQLNGQFEAVAERNETPPFNIIPLLKKYKPDYFVCTFDNPFIKEYREVCEQSGIAWVVFPRFNKGIYNMSTSEIIRRAQAL